MNGKSLSDLLHREVTRTEFLRLFGVALLFALNVEPLLHLLGKGHESPFVEPRSSSYGRSSGGNQ
jgi:hypothetical protein